MKPPISHKKLLLQLYGQPVKYQIHLKKAKLQLTHINKIETMHLRALVKIYVGVVANKQMPHITVLQINFVKQLITGKLNPAATAGDVDFYTHAHMYTYLVQKGYAVSFMGHSVQKLVQLGWVKIKK